MGIKTQYQVIFEFLYLIINFFIISFNFLSSRADGKLALESAERNEYSVSKLRNEIYIIAILKKKKTKKTISLFMYILY